MTHEETEAFLMQKMGDVEASLNISTKELGVRM